jgi:hypothetical protein
MAAPFAAAGALVLVPPMAGLRARLAYLLTWCGTREVTRRERSLDTMSVLQLIVATMILAAAIAVVKGVPNSGYWLPLRWFAGGIMVMAFAELVTASFVLVPAAFGVTVPPLMRSPWRSVSVAEFWTQRWNIVTSQKFFRPYCFTPLARHRVAFAMFATFALSGIVHALLAFMALGQGKASLIWGAFFVVQPLLIAAERQMNVRRWRAWAGSAWTLSALTITSPLFVAPALQIIEGGREWPESVWPPTFAVLGFVILVSIVITLASLAAAPSATDVQPAKIGVSKP